VLSKNTARTCLRLSVAAMSLSRRACCSSSTLAAKPSGSASYSSRSMTIRARVSVSGMVATFTDSPKRSSSCGRSSPCAAHSQP